MKNLDGLSIILGMGLVLGLMLYGWYTKQGENTKQKTNTENVEQPILLDADAPQAEKINQIKAWKLSNLKHKPMHQYHFMDMIIDRINLTQPQLDDYKTAVLEALVDEQKEPILQKYQEEITYGINLLLKLKELQQYPEYQKLEKGEANYASWNFDYEDIKHLDMLIYTNATRRYHLTTLQRKVR